MVDRVEEDFKLIRGLNGEELATHREMWSEIVEVAIGLNGLK